MKKNIIVTIILAVFVGSCAGAYFWYNYQLQNSKNLNIASRLVVSSVASSLASSFLSSSNSSNLVAQTTKSSTISSSSLLSTSVLKKGNFVTLDPLHYASGEVRIEKTGDKLEVVFADNFATNPDGPDLYVWLVPNQKLGGAIGGVDTKNKINLGQLANKKGSQKYSLTQQEYDQNNYAIVIWCQAFEVQFSNAILNYGN